ncbi:hypothetical protein CN324_15855 [Bacillus anthracis]|uniref:Uncharacterized protein n=3 Tax=Bacillus cereus group TaxID=86661 RepID=B9J527_BACCQ|nr:MULTISPECIES: hypothetical protein [Bacillus cereus group]ACM11257.1 conserved hypothetical protein [Bacillus cereus Q1]ALL22374.1 ATPase [Bacillus thuringiensis]ARO16712.1 hypothetical protein B2J90_04035 [Bacillus cereus]EAL16366.1 hypothetical protein protein [Bacillus cereus G9241]EEK85547.1 hypothetical protein bcere0010_6360 [Bacillus cereus ATCC 4342]EEL02125.1 hypothetical protein bcere0013_6680 [Bacillus cereus BDRD-ST26]EEM24135.1 hypothetical protein bthur0001_6520 [Bacillus th
MQQAMHFMSFALFISYLKDHLCEKERKDEKTDEKILITLNVSV